ncbi:MAG TPA: SRPBCC family protein [Mycobacteriales bacterium]|jgi:uncharacterized protein YndB with AHSA1/START domain|nr:SRPBCC family protein [Mycobacteriales bacterium]
MSTTEFKLTKAPTVSAGMLVRSNPEEVFRAFVDPAATTKFWFTKSSGKLATGVEVRWYWEMYDVSTQVRVKKVEQDRRIVFEWQEDEPLTVEFSFTPAEGDATFVEVTETGFGGSGDDILAHAVGSTDGFAIVLCGLKAWLEHGIELGAVRDRFPSGV